MTTKKEIELAQEILGLAMQINSTGRYCVWVEFPGHVNWLTVRIAESREKYNTEMEGWSNADRTVYLSEKDCEWRSASEAVKRLEGIASELRDIKSGAIDLVPAAESSSDAN